MSPGFSLRTLAQEMNLNTHAHYFDVIYGRKLTDKFLPKYVAWLKLNSREERYFRALVEFDQARNESLKKRAFEEMVECSPQLESLQVGARYVEFFEKWYQPVLMMLLTLHPKEKDPELLGRLFSPKLKATEIKQALAVLCKLRLVAWDEADKQWVLLNRFLKAEDSTREMALKPYHRKMQELGIYQYDTNYEKQKFASMTIATSEALVPEINEIVDRCRREIVDLVRKDPKEELLMQVNLQTFQIVRKK